MAGELIEAYASAWKPQDRRLATEWGAEFVKVPGSARASRFDPSASPWLVEPINTIPDNRNKEVVLLMPTGAGKTTVFDVSVPRAIAEDPGSVLLTQQTKPEADAYWSERLEPTLLNVEHIRKMIHKLPRGKKKKGTVILPHMTLYCVAANPTELQRKSVRWVFVDEAWHVWHGGVGEARARTHDRWNQRIVIVSQGGTTHIESEKQMVQTELAAAWNRTDRREFSMVCPECGEVQRWKMSALVYEGLSPTGEIDETVIQQSARYKCQGRCGQLFADNEQVKRHLANTSIYVPTNPKPQARHVGFHTSALALYFIPWGDLALEWTRANAAKKLGDYEPFKIFIQKRLAENYRNQETSPDVVLTASDYLKADFIDGQMWDGEIDRDMTIDRQRDHFYARIRAYQANGDSRLLWEGKLETIEMCRELQLQMKVKDLRVFEDAQHEPGQVYDDCAKYGWTAMHGSGEDGFMHYPPGKRPVKKLYSPVKFAQPPTQTGKARYIFFSSDRCKDMLASLLSGRGPAFESPEDASENYRLAMASESKRDVVNPKTKAVTRRWMKVSSRAPNHLWDCENIGVAVSLMLHRYKGHEQQFAGDGKPPEDPPPAD